MLGKQFDLAVHLHHTFGFSLQKYNKVVIGAKGIMLTAVCRMLSFSSCALLPFSKAGLEDLSSLLSKDLSLAG